MLRLIAACVMAALPMSSAAAQDWIVLGSWNIENLGERLLGQAPAALAEHISLSGVSILAVQEIHDTDGEGPPRTNRKMDDAVRILNSGTGDDWTYEIFPKRRTTDDSQLVGVMWNRARATKVGETYRIPIDNQNGTLWDRHPHAIKLALGPGRTDLVIVPLHMKANVNCPWGGCPAQRRREAEALIAEVASIRDYFDDSDIVILGDTNFKKRSEAAAQSFVAAGFADLNNGDRPTYASGSAPFDRIYVVQGQEEFRYSKQYNLLASDSEGHRRTLSDHFLVLTSMRVMNDDD